MLAAEYLVRLVAERGAYASSVSGREVAEMTDLIDGRRRLRSPNSACEFIDVDQLFHTALANCVGNGLLTKFYDACALTRSGPRSSRVPLDRPAGRRARRTRGNRTSTRRRRRVAGDASGAAIAITDHLQAMLTVLLAALPDPPLPSAGAGSCPSIRPASTRSALTGASNCATRRGSTPSGAPPASARCPNRSAEPPGGCGITRTAAGPSSCSRRARHRGRRTGRTRRAGCTR